MATPVLTSAKFNDITLGESGTVTLTLAFDRTMDIGVNPSILFPTVGEDAAPALAIQSQGWQAGATTFVITYSISDQNFTIANVDYRVQGAQESTIGDVMNPTLVDDSKVAGDSANFNQFSLDQIAPAQPTIDLDTASDTGVGTSPPASTSNTDDLTFDSTPSFTITAEAGSTVNVFLNGGVTPIASGTATGGVFTFTVSPGLAAGHYDFTATATDASGNVSPVGNLGINIDFTGTPNADTIIGSNQDDVIVGNGGIDTLTGLGGNDIYFVDDGNDVVNEVAGQGTADRVFTSVSYALPSGVGPDAFGVEILTTNDYGSTNPINLIGNANNNTIVGNAGNNIIDGRQGQDSMAGLGGDDIYFVNDFMDQVTEAVGEGTDRVYSNIIYTLPGGSEIEILAIADSSQTRPTFLTGNEFSNTIFGSAGIDTIDGRGGIDDMVGFGGSDVYSVDNPNDMVREAVGEGTQDVVNASVSYRLPTGSEIETLQAIGSNPIDLTGNEFNNLLIGNSAANTLDGMGGADEMRGLSGNDIYFVDNVNDIVRDNSGQGTDRVFTSVSYTLGSDAEIELMTTTQHDGTQAINLTGNDFNNTIYGNAGDNVLDGKGGVDELVGQGGNDTYFVDNASDRVDEIAGQGNDRVFTSVSFNLTAGQEIERLETTNSAGTGALNLRGNAFDNVVIGNAGDNVIAGSSGNDTLQGLGGHDSFAFETALNIATNVDQIVDFTVGQDLITLASEVFTGLGTHQSLSDANFLVVGSRGQDADDRVLYDASIGALHFDADGNGPGAAITFAFITPGTNLHASDIFVV